MADSYEKRDTLPLTWIGRVPIYAATVVAALEVIGLIVFAVLRAAHVPLYYFAFSPVYFWKQYGLWTLLTYPLISEPNFFSLFSVYFIYRYGCDLEGYLGRRVFLRILFLLILLQPLICTAIWLMTGGNPGVVGNYAIAIGIFIACATLYPNAEVWNWMPMKWVAFAGLFLCALSFVPDHDWLGLSLLLAVAGAAHALVRYERGHWAMPQFRLPTRKPKLRVLPKPSAAPRRIPREELIEDTATDSEVDLLLDKIAKSGIASLTAGERARLEKARQELLKRERE